LIINGSGEFSLSRDLKRIRELTPAVNVVTGTYTSTREGVLLRKVCKTRSFKTVG